MKFLNSFLAVLTILVAACPLNAQVAPLTVPINDNFGSRIELFGTNILTTGNNVLATVEPGEPTLLLGYDNERTVWWEWTSPVGGITKETATFVTVSVLQSNFFGFVSIFRNLAPPLEVDDLTRDRSGRTVRFRVFAGETYYLQVQGGYFLFADAPTEAFSASGFINLQIQIELPPPANDNFAQAQVISGQGGAFRASNLGGTKEFGEPRLGGDVPNGDPGGEPTKNLAGQSLWYRWTAPKSGPAKILTSGAGFKTVLGVFVGPEANNLFNAANPQNLGVISSTPNSLEFRVIGGETYSIAVDGEKGKVGDISLVVAQGPLISVTGNPNFGPRKIGSKTSKSITVRNLGTSTLKIRSVTLPNRYRAKLKKSIEPGKSASISVEFSPNAVKSFNGPITVNSNAVSGKNTVFVTGKGF